MKKRFPNTLLLFVSPPSAEVLKARLTGRGTETSEVIAQRLARAAEEAEGMEDSDYFVVNDLLEECVEQVHRIVEGERSRVFRNKERMEAIRAELKEFQKG